MSSDHFSQSGACARAQNIVPEAQSMQDSSEKVIGETALELRIQK
jgi:hypothetical protein